jgi:hypothetical protein
MQYGDCTDGILYCDVCYCDGLGKILNGLPTECTSLRQTSQPVFTEYCTPACDCDGGPLVNHHGCKQAKEEALHAIYKAIVRDIHQGKSLTITTFLAPQKNSQANVSSGLAVPVPQSQLLLFQVFWFDNT